MLVDKIRVIPPNGPLAPEDFLSGAVGTIFSDDLRNEHGDPGATVVYSSAKFGDIRLSIEDPATEDARKLFAHYLWNAAVFVAEQVTFDPRWTVEDASLLELGAGLGLGGIVGCLNGASRVVITDYPSPTLLQNINRNVGANVRAASAHTVKVCGHQWGELDTAFAQANKGSFSRILSADCLWMPWEHRNLARSMLYFLSPDPTARVFVVAGFHTGRANVASFIDVVLEEGFAVESLSEENVDGQQRPWERERDGGREDPTERKRWLAVAVLKRKDQS